MAKWTKREVERLYDAVACNRLDDRRHFSDCGAFVSDRESFTASQRLDRVKAIFVEGGHSCIPQRRFVASGCFEYEGGFCPYYLWQACIASYDAAILEFLDSVGFVADDSILDERVVNPIAMYFSERGVWSGLYRSISYRYSLSGEVPSLSWGDMAKFIREANDLGFLLLGCEEWCTDRRSLSNMALFARESLHEVVLLFIQFMPDEEIPLDVLCSLPLFAFRDRDLQWALNGGRIEAAIGLFLLDSDWVDRLRRGEHYFYGTPLYVPDTATVPMLEKAERAGMEFDQVMTPTENIEVLRWAARRHAIPIAWEVGFEKVFEDRISGRGMENASRSLDYESIRLFLENGAKRCVDVRAAYKAGRDDLLCLYESFGIETARVTKGFTQDEIWDGSSFVDDDGAIDIPNGVRIIHEKAFWKKDDDRFFLKQGADAAKKPCDIDLVLPSSVESIGDYAFSNRPFRKVALPSSVKSVGAYAFYKASFVSLYDSIDEDGGGRANEAAHSRGDTCNSSFGSRYESKVGLINTFFPVLHTRSHTVASPCTIEVRSVKTRLVKYRVFMPGVSAPQYVRDIYAANWGHGASFDFSKVDGLFEKLGDREAKTRTALNRLAWSVNLSEDDRETFSAYLRRNRVHAVRYCLADNDDAGLRFLDALGYIDDGWRSEFAQLAREYQCSDEVVYRVKPF